MNIFNKNQSLGEIVSILPKASDIFKEYKIDFCCGGHRPLTEALEEQNIKEQELLERLDEAYEAAKQLQNQTDFRSLSSADLIDYVVNKHHVYLKITLPQISELASTILRVHGANHRELYHVYKLFHSLKMELEQHLIKEEELLFPMIKQYELNPSDDLYQKVISVMEETEAEHDGAGDILKELRKITEDYRLPEDVCGTYILTYEKIKELEADLFEHIHLENNILFKRFGTQVV